MLELLICCAIALEIQDGWTRLRPACPASRQSTQDAVSDVLSKANTEETRISFGRIVYYPWISELLARQALVRPVVRFAGLNGGLRSGAGLVALELIDVVHDLAELADEEVLLLGCEPKPGQSGDFPYFFDV